MYKNIETGIADRSSSFIYNEKANLPIIRTVIDFLSNESCLSEYVEYVGGFPLIVKVIGGSHGVGVIKVDSLESLKSLADYFKNNKIEPILRQFIQHKKQGRLIVLGKEVIASHINYASLDFRTNVGENLQRKREAFVFPENVQEIAVQAVNSIGLEFGGVDILFDENDNEKPYIAEVNFPCFFPTTQHLTGINIADKMIDYLINKAK